MTSECRRKRRRARRHSDVILLLAPRVPAERRSDKEGPPRRGDVRGVAPSQGQPRPSRLPGAHHTAVPGRGGGVAVSTPAVINRSEWVWGRWTAAVISRVWAWIVPFAGPLFLAAISRPSRLFRRRDIRSGHRLTHAQGPHCSSRDHISGMCHGRTGRALGRCNLDTARKLSAVLRGVQARTEQTAASGREGRS
jgi:hypothetical protein